MRIDRCIKIYILLKVHFQKEEMDMQISEITAFLEHAYDVLNDKWFDGELPHAVITIQSTPGRYGHFTLTKAWWIT